MSTREVYVGTGQPHTRTTHVEVSRVPGIGVRSLAVGSDRNERIPLSTRRDVGREKRSPGTDSLFVLLIRSASGLNWRAAL